jgi:hypothetical protein
MKIPGSHLLDDVLGEWSWANMSHIAGLNYHVENPIDGYTTLSLETSWSMGSHDRSSRCDATVIFRRVSRLSLKEVGGIIQTGGFYVDDIRSRGWSDIRYEVGDFETGVLSFYCEYVEVTSVRAFLVDTRG